MSPAVEVAWITGACAILASAIALIPSHFQRKRLKEVHNQVKNSHGTNLRDDLDRVMHGVQVVVEELRNQRVDLMWERRERMDLGARVEKIEEVLLD